MSAEGEGTTEGAPKGASALSKEGADAFQRIAQYLTDRAVKDMRRLTPEAEFQMDVRKGEGRSKILEQLVLEVCPDGVDIGAWREWITGGRTPFEKRNKKVSADTKESPAQTLTRSTPRVKKQEDRIKKMRNELAEQERMLLFYKAYDNAALHWHVVDQLISIMSPVFAMGPAWTVLRSLSGFTTDEMADRATRTLVGKQKESAMKELRETRAKESAEILEGLDFLSGHEIFEKQLRAAILDVIRKSDPFRQELVMDGRRPRSEAKRKNEVHPMATANADEVLEGLTTDKAAA